MTQAVNSLAQGFVKQMHGDAATAIPASGWACQPVDDTKAFKAFTGRGRAGQGDLCKLQASLQHIHDEMAELVNSSKMVPGRSFYLTVHRRATNGQHSLRWRSMGGNRHLPWGAMPALFAAQLPSLARWYAELQQRIKALNRKECVVRSALRHAQKSV